METWKKIPGYENYEVSTLGKVKSLNYKGSGKSRLMNPSKHKHGYMVVSIKGIKKVHQLVAMAFLNHTPCGHEILIDHINEDKSDNRLCNLRLSNNRDNVARQFKRDLPTGVYKIGKRYRAGIHYKDERKHLGYFDTPEEASLVIENYIKEYGR